MAKTVAERQRESRARKRDIVTPQSVTGVTKQPERDTDNPLADIPYIDLSIRLHYMRDWKQSPEYKEVMRRLHTRTVEQLEAEGQFVPCWKYREVA